MNPQVLKMYARILNPEISLPVAFVVFLSSFIASSPSVLAAVSAFLVSSCALIINDFINIPKYRMKNPDKSMLSRKISLKFVSVIMTSMGIIGCLLAYVVSPQLLFISIISIILFSLYSWKLKELFFSEIIIGILIHFIVLSGGIAAGNASVVFHLSVIVFFSSVSFIIYSHIQDFMKNKRHDHTLVTKLGLFKSRMAADIFIIVSILLSFVPFLLGVLGSVYMFFIIISDIIFLLAMALPKKTVLVMKIAFVFLFIAFIMASLEVSILGL